MREIEVELAASISQVSNSVPALSNSVSPLSSSVLLSDLISEYLWYFMQLLR